MCTITKSWDTKFVMGHLKVPKTFEIFLSKFNSIHSGWCLNNIPCVTQIAIHKVL
jgi:hypothetical protein